MFSAILILGHCCSASTHCTGCDSVNNDKYSGSNDKYHHGTMYGNGGSGGMGFGHRGSGGMDFGYGGSGVIDCKKETCPPTDCMGFFDNTYVCSSKNYLGGCNKIMGYKECGKSRAMLSLIASARAHTHAHTQGSGK